MRGALPSSYRIVGELLVSNGKAFYGSPNNPDSNIPVDEATFKSLDSSSCYYADKNHVYSLYQGINTISNDVKVFEILHTDGYYSSRYAKDSRAVFFNGKEIEHADPKTFHTYKGWGIDAQHVWYDDNLVPEADAKTANFDYPYYFFTDHGHAYYCAQILSGVDMSTFEVIGDSAYAKDKNNIYFMSKIIENVDKKSFKIKSWNEAKDSQGKIYNGERL